MKSSTKSGCRVSRELGAIQSLESLRVSSTCNFLDLVLMDDVDYHRAMGSGQGVARDEL